MQPADRAILRADREIEDSHLPAASVRRSHLCWTLAIDIATSVAAVAGLTMIFALGLIR